MADPSPRSDASGQVVLLIDEDPNAVRLARLSLQGPTCNVLTATRHLEGLRIAARQKPQLILMETRFRGIDGFALAGKLLQSPETEASTIAFLTEDRSLGSRLRGFQLGAAEYIQKPVDGKQLASRISALFARLEKGRPKAPEGPAAGELVELVQRAEANSLTGTLALQRGSQAARIRFLQGVVQSAECGHLRGEEALNEIVSRGDWTLSFEETGATAPEVGAIRRRGTSDETLPEMPGRTTPAKSTPVKPAPPQPAPSRPVKHVSSSLTTTVHDNAVANPRPPRPSFAPEPGFNQRLPLRSELDEDETVVDPNAITLPVQQTDHEVVVPRFESDSTDKGGPIPASPLATPSPAAASVPRFPDDSASDAFGQQPPPEPADGYDEDIPTAMSFKAQEVREISAPGSGLEFVVSAEEELLRASPARAGGRPLPQVVTPTSPSGSGPGASRASLEVTMASREALHRWLAEEQATLLIVAPPTAESVHVPLQQAAEKLGFVVHYVATGLDAYRFALERRPTAILSDLRGPDLDGRELLAAIRSDFCVRETPFIMVSSDYLTRQLKRDGLAGLNPIVQGLEVALAPRSALKERSQTGGELSGWVEPIGLSYLLRTLGSAGLSGRLQLSNKEGRGAVVIFRRGEICGATVSAAQATVGPMAMLHLLGYEWQQYVFVQEAVDSGRVPLGALDQLIETSFQQNNMLLARIYQQGVQIEDVGVDSNALDNYLQRIPPGSLDLLIRLVEGEKAAVLAEKNLAAPGLLKSILHDLRRKAVIQPLSMKPVKVEDRPTPALRPDGTQIRRRRRWLVVLVASLVTVLLAAGSYFAYRYFSNAARTRSGAPPKPAI